MKLLAIDTSSNACSVALMIGDAVTENHVVEPREHTRILMPMISRLLDDSGIVPADLDAVVLGNGPGSFIGMRIGASVTQGLCHGAGLNVIPVSSLAAVGAEVFATSAAERVAVLQDARMNEVYVGCFKKGANGLPVAMDEERICKVGPLSLADQLYVGAGGGWDRYPELRDANAEWVENILPVVVPRARYLLQLGAAAAADAVSPEALVPAYLRQKVAEVPSTRQ